MTDYNGVLLVERIRKICRTKGISIAQMEKALDWSQGLISRWTKNSPSIAKVMAVVQYLGVTYEDLLGDINSKSDSTNEKRWLSRKLYEVTEKGGMRWQAWDRDFQNDNVQMLLDSGENCKVFFSAYQNGRFLVVLNKDYDGDLVLGALCGQKGKILYTDDEPEEWLEKLLEKIDQKEFDIWNEKKTKYYIEKFMQTEFDMDN